MNLNTEFVAHLTTSFVGQKEVIESIHLVAVRPELRGHGESLKLHIPCQTEVEDWQQAVYAWNHNKNPSRSVIKQFQTLARGAGQLTQNCLFKELRL